MQEATKVSSHPNSDQVKVEMTIKTIFIILEAALLENLLVRPATLETIIYV